jgi:hypothetical protein
MNKTLAIVAIVVATALAAGVYATSMQAAFADSVSFSQKIKQKSRVTCLSCSGDNGNNIAVNFADFSSRGGG